MMTIITHKLLYGMCFDYSYYVYALIIHIVGVKPSIFVVKRINYYNTLLFVGLIIFV